MSSDYRKLVLISPGLIHLRKALRRAHKRRNLQPEYYEKKNTWKQAIAAVLIKKTFCIYWLQTKLQKRHIINRIQEKTS